jgi:hypothetical protein
MAAAVYILGTLVSLACAMLLLRGYARAKRKLLLWSGLCFAGLTVSNALIFVDLEVLQGGPDLYWLRLAVAAAAMMLLLYGLIWERD